MKGSQQKMREALVLIADEAEVIEAHFKRENAPQWLIRSVSNIINLAREYRSIPLRQCDIGTPEEQLRRFAASLESLKCDSIDIKCAYCALRWAQMPYKAEREGENDGK